MTAEISLTADNIPAKRRTRPRFYMGMSLLLAVTVFIGFAPTYFLREMFGAPPLNPLRHIHGIAFTAWIAVLFIQTVLVAAGRTDLHRKLGVAAACLAVFMVFIGVATAVESIRANHTPPGIDARAFLILPMADILLFAVLVAAGIAYRKRPEIHKRLMLLATIAITDAAVARFPGMMEMGPPAFFLTLDLFIVACVAYDYWIRKRVSPAYIWGGLLIVLSQPLRLMIAETPLWLAFGDWVKG